MVDSGWQNGNHNPRTPPRVRKTDTFIVFYLFILHSVTCLKTCHFAACFTIPWTSISVFCVETARDVVTVLLIFAKYLSLYLHIFTCTWGTHTQAHMYNQHTKKNGDNQAQGPGWEGRKKGFVRDLAHAKKKCQEKLIFTNLQKGFEHIELPAKLLDYFLRSNKSNINQNKCMCK